jgi:hypothetical protein
MPLLDSMLELTPYPPLSAAIWIIAALAFLYLARKYFHQCVRRLTRLVRNVLRLASASVRLAEKRLESRNRKVLLERGRQDAERRLTKEFQHIHSAVEKHLKIYATLHRRASEVIADLEADHRQSMDLPPALPNWVPVIEAVARIEHPGDRLVADALANIHGTLEKQHATAIETYRSASKKRHGRLKNMLPRWLKLQKMLAELETSVTALIERSKTVDRHMNDYRRFQEGRDTPERAVLRSSLTQFLVSGLFLMAAAAGAVINIHLIELPMSEMVGGGNYIGPFKASGVAAIVMTAIELGLGLFVMESLGITRLFPIIGGMDDTRRHRMFACLLGLLFAFAGVEASLGVLRDRLVADMASLKQMLSGVEYTPSPAGMIPAAAQMMIGFVLPFWIALGAIPLAAFMSSARSVIGAATAAALRFGAFFLRLCGNLAVDAGKVVVVLYDLVIFPTLWVESALGGASRKSSALDEPKSGFGCLKKFKKETRQDTSSLGWGESRK